MEKLRRPLQLVQTARTTQFQRSSLIYVLNNYQSIVLCYNGVIFVFIVFYVDPAAGLPYTINLCVVLLLLLLN